MSFMKSCKNVHIQERTPKVVYESKLFKMNTNDVLTLISNLKKTMIHYDKNLVNVAEFKMLKMVNDYRCYNRQILEVYDELIVMNCKQ